MASTLAERIERAPGPLRLVHWFASSLTRHRDLLFQMVGTDLRGRYVGSTLGLFWTVIHPLVMIGIYVIVFSKVMGTRLAGSADPYAYSLSLVAALLPWSAFQEVMSRTTTVFPDNAALVRKVAFPKSILFGFITLSSAVNLSLAVALFLVFVLLTGHVLPLTALWWPVVMGVHLGFGLGLGILASVVHVFIRDTAQLLTVVLQVWFWLTPIIYVPTILPEWMQAVQPFNPQYQFAVAHRQVVIGGVSPTLGQWAILLGPTVVVLLAGLAAYQRFRADIFDEL